MVVEGGPDTWQVVRLLMGTTNPREAAPGTIRGAHYEDPPLFSSEVNPSCGHSIRQSIGPLFALFGKYLGDQWSIGDWQGMQAAVPRELPPLMGALASLFEAMVCSIVITNRAAILPAKALPSLRQTRPLLILLSHVPDRG